MLSVDSFFVGTAIRVGDFNPAGACGVADFG